MTTAATTSPAGVISTPALKSPPHRRFAELDGWRAVSILLVLATHMLPLGPKWMQLNAAAGPAGMSLFFTLSGFLITATLLRNAGVVSFFIRRLFRIVPLALVGGSLILLLQSAPLAAYWPVWLYYLNYAQPVEGVSHISHFWSLCVEMHFYAGVGLLVALLGRRALWLLPVLALGVTGLRIAHAETVNIKTHYRVDEILAGATLALAVLCGPAHQPLPALAALRSIPLLLIGAVFAASCHPASGPVQYARPYLGAALVGRTLLAPGWYSPLLESRQMRYIAEISYALYVIHPATMMGWLGSGDTLTRYLKRPLCFALTFGLAHLSTFFFERPLTTLGRAIADRAARPVPASL